MPALVWEEAASDDEFAAGGGRLDHSRLTAPVHEPVNGIPQPPGGPAPGTFVGMISPFAEDTTPLDAEALPESEAPNTQHMRSRSAGRLSGIALGSR